MHAALTELQLDALKEIANIGCGNAATALSQLLGGRRIDIDVPTAGVVQAGEIADRLGGPEAPVFAVSLDMRGGAQGHLQLALPEESARALAALLLGHELAKGTLPDDAQSSLAEVGNILASAYMNAIGRAVGLTLLPSIPRCVHGPAGAIVEEAVARLGAEAAKTLLLHTRFSAGGKAGEPLRFFFGHFLVIPDPRSVPRLLAALGLG